jgi:hypothetical protein
MADLKSKRYVIDNIEKREIEKIDEDMKVYWLKIVEITKKSESEDSKIVSQV